MNLNSYFAAGSRVCGLCLWINCPETIAVPVLSKKNVNDTYKLSSSSKIIFPTEESIISNDSKNISKINEKSINCQNNACDKKRKSKNLETDQLFPRLNLNGKPNCLDESNYYCENVNSYPKLNLNELFYSNENFMSLFNFNEEIGSRKILETPFNEDEQPLCRYTQKIIFPKVAMNQDNQWLFVVNGDNEFRQAVTAEICSNNEKSECFSLQQNLPYGTETHCKQKYTHRRLLALHPINKTMYTDMFKFPSCCSCFIKSSLGRSNP